MDAGFAALSDGNRRTILESLADGEATAGELAERLPIARPGVSRHLRVLREPGLVRVEPRARQRVYSLAPQSLDQAEARITARTSQWRSRLAALDAEVRRARRESINEKRPTSS